MGTPCLACRELFQKNLEADQRLQEASLLKAAAAEETCAAEEVKCQAASQTAALHRREAQLVRVLHSFDYIYWGEDPKIYVLLYITLYYVMLCFIISCICIYIYIYINVFTYIHIYKCI